jgi:Flp pilus assembly protein TadG
LALLLPVICTMVLGCVDFGRFAYMSISVANAARAGAGVASFNPVSSGSQSNWNRAIRQAVYEEMSGQMGFDEQHLTIETPLVIKETDHFPRVRIQVAYAFHAIVNWPLLPSETQITSAVEMCVIR